ncbi:uncharacterized protein LOC143020169 [Oratosquilla oratoria]|uniref:uncharacterized protein LOC143020169 n=1 Tax=Oratosquilla oratoria TaxID=337810 RepID=UPI003F771370
MLAKAAEKEHKEAGRTTTARENELKCVEYERAKEPAMMYSTIVLTTLLLAGTIAKPDKLTDVLGAGPRFGPQGSAQLQGSYDIPSPDVPSGLYDLPTDPSDNRDQVIAPCNPSTVVSVVTDIRYVPSVVVTTRTRALPTTIFRELVQTTYIPTTVVQQQVITSVVPPVIQTQTQLVTDVQYITRASYITEVAYVTDTQYQYVTETQVQTQVQTQFQTQYETQVQQQFVTQTVQVPQYITQTVTSQNIVYNTVTSTAVQPQYITQTVTSQNIVYNTVTSTAYRQQVVTQTVTSQNIAYQTITSTAIQQQYVTVVSTVIQPSAVYHTVTAPCTTMMAGYY